ncbi:lysM domain receptor-like kinase 3 [Rutidosis leptorrhynchoides]|uniref:lysM domain receptor-like kinase 3 n=1 Tax=Rutidosis leptorrhynchoides TaxID=125765 RepID=UPI003A99C76A
MCKTKMAINASEPKLTKRKSSKTTQRSSSSTSQQSNNNQSLTNLTSISTYSYGTASGSGSAYRLNSSTATAEASFSTTSSLSRLRNSLPENTNIYDFSEIRSATNNFLSKRVQSSSSSSSSPAWKCNLRGKDVVVFQRKFRRSIQESELREKLSVIYRSHHMSVIKLLGASISGDYIYLAYDFISGGNLTDCLRNKRNPEFTVLNTWMSRIQIATDLASGLDYIHNNAGLNVNLVHKYVKSSSVIVTEPSFNAKICHFGTAELCGETVIDPKFVKNDVIRDGDGEINEIDLPKAKELTRSDSRAMRFEGIKGYMSPEFNGLATQKSDVYAFGVLILELLSGEEPVRYKYDKESGNHVKIMVVETARGVMEGGDVEGVEGRLRRWVDRRLKDSFPVRVVERLTRIGLECVEEDPNKRPNMSRVAGKVSKLYLDSRKWADTIRVPTEFTSSFAPR